MNTKLKHTMSILLAAMVITSLSGCKRNGDTSLTESDTSDTSNSGIDGDYEEVISYSDESFDMRYKHWFDNPEVADSQKDSLALAKSGTLSDGKYLSLFPLYVDKSGREYYISGRESVYVPSSVETYGLSRMRDENGKLHYPHLTGVTDTSYPEDFLAAVGDQTPSTNYEDYAEDRKFVELSEGIQYQVFINNLKTDIQVDTVVDSVPLHSWFVDYNLLTVDPGDYSTYTVYLNTGAGIRTVLLNPYEGDDLNWRSGWNVSCLEDSASVTVSGSDVFAFGDELYFTLEALERILGYKVQVYDNVVNIITDNKDLADKDSVMPSLQLPVVVDTDKPSTPKQPARR